MVVWPVDGSLLKVDVQGICIYCPKLEHVWYITTYKHNDACVVNVVSRTLHMLSLFLQLNEDWNIDAGSYTFTKLDPDNEEHRQTVNKFFLWEGDFGGEVADGKIFK